MNLDLLHQQGRLSQIRDRLLARVATNDRGCWEWQGHRFPFGYGALSAKDLDDGRRTYSTHRLAYRVFVGPVPADRLVLHHCDNPPCINPEHLYLGTAADNVRDMGERGRAGGRFVRQEFCRRGHVLEGNRSSSRMCRICRNEAQQSRRARLGRPQAAAKASRALGRQRDADGMMAPLVIHGQRCVRIRSYSADMGLFRVRMWGAFDPHGRKRLSPPLTNRAAVARWVTEQGWRYLGSQEPAA